MNMYSAGFSFRDLSPLEDEQGSYTDDDEDEDAEEEEEKDEMKEILIIMMAEEERGEEEGKKEHAALRLQQTKFKKCRRSFSEIRTDRGRQKTA